MEQKARDEVVLAVDAGTSSVKVGLIARNGRLVADASVGYRTRTRPGGFFEQDAADWWTAFVKAVSSLPSRQRQHVRAISMTGQMQDVILVDDTGPVAPVLLYSDSRAAAEHADLLERCPGWVERAGNELDPTNVAAKLLWLRRHTPDRLEAAESVLFGSAGFLLWRCGGEPACDVTTASASGVLDTSARDWDHEVLAAAGVGKRQVPRLLTDVDPESSVVGTLSEEAADELGLRPDLPLIHATGDAGSTTDGLVSITTSSAYAYLGTTGWFARVTDVSPNAGRSGPALGPSPLHGLAPTSAHLHTLVLPGWNRVLRIGAVLTAGAASAWARKVFLNGASFADADTRAEAAYQDHPFGRLLVLPSLAGERAPVRTADARGVVVGLTERTTSADLYIATLTGVALNLRHVADDLGVRPEMLPVVGGGARSPVWRRILASTFGVPVLTRDDGEPGLISAARLAADALGWDHEVQPLFKLEGSEHTAPGPEASDIESAAPVHRALYDALASTFARLAQTGLSGRN